MKVVFSLFAVVFFFAYANAQTSWYVDQNTGSDSNAGLTPAEAFSTVEFAAEEHASPGDSVFIIGTYVNTSYDPTYS